MGRGSWAPWCGACPWRTARPTTSSSSATRSPPGPGGRASRRHPVLHRFVAALPAARRVLALGAGHNLCWEPAPLSIPVGHVPSHRRYDATFARALRFGRAILADLEVFLG